jgi:predicted PurR-regulated permease PerM
MQNVVESEARLKRPSSWAGGLISFVLILGLLYIGRIFFITLISAVLLAFILEPLVGLLMRLKLPRGAASFVACTLMLGVVYLAALGVWTQAIGFWEDLPVYSRRIRDLVDSASSRIEKTEKYLQDILVPKKMSGAQSIPEQPKNPAKSQRKRRDAEPPPDPMTAQVPEVRIRPDEPAMVALVYQYLERTYDVLLMASFVPFLVYFFLSWRDHFRRALMGFVGGESRLMVERAWDGIATVARAYVVGNFLLGILLSVTSAVFFWFVNLPYWQLAGPASGFLSLIPYLGLPLAIIPPFICALTVYDGLGAYLIIGSTVALLHMFALNLLYPKLVGARVHLNPLVVTVALMLWYLLWGGAGLVLAIPITASVKAVCDSIPRLRGYGRLLGD